MTSRFSRITTALFSAVLLSFSFNNFAYAEDAPVAAEALPEVLFNTSAGDFLVRLYPDKAPLTVANFLAHVDSGHYESTIFHRVINGFMIQGGGFTADMTKKPVTGSVQNEADNGLINDVGTIAMARTNDPHSANAQFFINVSDNQFLNHTAKTASGWGYTVFGEVFCGFDVISKIKKVETGRAGRMTDVPTEAIVIYKATKL